MFSINKKTMVLVGLLILAAALLLWPQGKDASLPEKSVVAEKLKSGKAEETSGSALKESLASKIPGHYSGRVTVESIEMVGKSIISKIPVALAKKQLEEDLAQGFEVDLVVTSSGEWTLDLGDVFAQYQITTISSTTEDGINLEDGSFEAQRGFYVPDLGDTLTLSLKGHILERVQGTLLLEGDTSMVKLSIVGSFSLDKIN